MAAFNVSTINLADYGYPEQVDFGDPMSELFCAKPYTSTNIRQVESVLLPYYQNLDAYPDAAYVQSALDAYYTSPQSRQRKLPPRLPPLQQLLSRPQRRLR